MVTVVGAGVLGLTCAVLLAEAGTEVHVLARDLPAETSSAGEAGLCLPWARPGPGDPADDPRPVWAALTQRTLRELAGRPSSGVRLLAGRTGAGTPVGPVPAVHLPRYLDGLAERLRAAGGTLTRLSVPRLPTHGPVLNATGLAARALAGDPSVRAGTAQSVLLSDPGLTGWRLDDGAVSGYPLLVVPHGRVVVVTGPGRLDAWGHEPDPDVGRSLLERATRLAPELTGARVLGHRLLQRAVRPVPVVGGQGRVVHCYGMGADALRLSWGAAEVAVTAVRAAAAEELPQP